MTNKTTNNLLLTTTDLSIEQLIALQSSPPHDIDWGVDTVALSIPVESNVAELAHNGWSGIKGDQTETVDKSRWYTNFTVGWANVNVSYSTLYGSITLTFCAPKVLAPTSTALLPPNALEPLVENLLLEVVPQIPVLPRCMTIDEHGTIDFQAGWQSHIKIARLDCARNFQISKPDYLRHALARVISSYSKVAHTYWSKTSWTRSNMTKNEGMDRMYDKSMELLNHELDEQFHWEVGIYRFEAELKRSRLQKTGLMTLDRVNDERVWYALHWRWEQSNWGIFMPGQGSLGELLSGLKEEMRLRFVGYLALHSKGLGDLVEEKEARKLGRIAAGLNIVPGAELTDYGAMNHYLSLWHGCEVRFCQSV